MKFRYQSLVVMFVLAASLLGCDPRESIIKYQIGVWNVTSLKTVEYRDEVLASDQTRTDSLGQMEFLDTGEGFRTDALGNKESFTWEHYPKQDRLVIYYLTRQFENATILEKEDDAMTLTWVNTGADGIVQLRIESTSTIERVK